MPVSIRAVVLDSGGSPIPQLLQESGAIDVIGVTHTLKDLRHYLPHWEPDVICLNMTLIRSLPVLIATIAQHHRQTRCVIVRYQEDATMLAHYLGQGAIGYTMKDDFTDCAVVVSQAAYRTAWIDAAVALAINSTLQQAASKRQITGSILPPNEQLILDHIILGKSYQDIATLNVAWNDQAVLAQIYNLLIHYQQIAAKK